MAKYLVIVESPKKAKTIGKYLGVDFVVKSSSGHIRDLTKGSYLSLKQLKESVERAFAGDSSVQLADSIGVDPFRGWVANYEVIRGKSKVVRELRKLAKQVDYVYLATDLDREGEAIAWHLQELIGGSSERFRRVVFNEITETAISSAFNSPSEVNINRVNAQQARRFLDRVLGFELTPLLSSRIAKKLSGGRVQSVAVRLIVEREREIRKYEVKEYWDITGCVFREDEKTQAGEFSSQKGFKFRVDKYDGMEWKPNAAAPPSKEQADKLQSELQAASCIVTQLESRETGSKPNPPFTTSTLQQTASSRLGFSVKKTMTLAQHLYEDGHISYMRTDSTFLSKSAVDNARNFVQKRYGEDYLPATSIVYQTKTRAAQEAHEAVRPTDVSETPRDFDGDRDQQRLYELIWQRFVACQMSSAVYESVTTRIRAGKFQLSIRGRNIKFDGYTRVYPQLFKTDENIPAPSFAKDEELSLTEVCKKQRFTQPPSRRYSEAGLVRELESRGIGRPSTYVPIITTIQDRGYVSVRNRRFYAEPIGELVTDRLTECFENLMEYEFTAELEKELDQISAGDKYWKDVLKVHHDDFAKRFVRAADEENGMKRNEPVTTDIPCPKCDRCLLIRTASTGLFLGCSGYSASADESCEHTERLTLQWQKFSKSDEEAEGRELKEKTRCSRCTERTPMDEYLTDDYRKLFVCASPNCDGFELRAGNYYEGPVIECEKCCSDMFVKEGRFGKYFACTNETCTNTRKVLRDGTAAPPKVDPIDMPELRCEGINDHYVLRDGASGLFLAASKFPKHRKTRAPLVRELLPHANELDPKFKYLLDAPEQDPDGNLTSVRFLRATGQHYVRADGGKNKWSAFYKDGRWIPASPSEQ